MATLAKDSLSAAQKANLTNYINDHIYFWGHNKLSIRPLYANDLYTNNRKKLEHIRAILCLRKKTFDNFRTSIKKPAIWAKKLGLNPKNKAQIFAAKKYFKATFQTPPSIYNPTMVNNLYMRKMASAKKKLDHYEISLENKLLIENMPVSVWLTTTSPVLKGLLSNIYFTAPKGRTKYETAQYIYKTLLYLMKNPKMSPYIKAFSKLIREKGARIMISFNGSTAPFSDESAKNKESNHITTGFYDRGKTIYIGSSIHTTKLPGRFLLRSIVHESQHMLFYHLVNNDGSPVKKGSPLEEKLDEAISKDRVIWSKLKPDKLSYTEKKVLEYLVNNLEKSKSYFIDEQSTNGQHNFNPKKEDHWHTMRVESIVRPLSMIAFSPISAEKALKKVSPNLFRFFNKHCVKMFNNYSKKKITATPPNNATTHKVAMSAKMFFFFFIHFFAAIADHIRNAFSRT